MRRRLRFTGLLAAASAAATVTAASATPTGDSTQGVRNGEWIAYSTAPYGAMPSTIARRNWGSDIFLVRQGGQPILVAGRGAGRSWNACPTFAPDGMKLAFGTKTPGVGKSVTVVRVTHAGASAARRVRMRVVGSDDRLAPCPLWSSDGSRLAYMSAGKVVVRGLDGSTPRARAGDPVKADFAARTAGPLTSPASDLVARRLGCGVVVERADGSRSRALQTGLVNGVGCPYAVAAWSPDGLRLLLMFDVSGWHFTMIAASVKPPLTHVPVVEHVRVPNSHTWPGRGDVSWQPRPS
jgi:WD40-like Beta Propeller Repeat